MSGLDGDASAKSMDSGANSSLNNQNFGETIHEGGHQAQAAGEKMTGQGTSVFDKEGAIGKHFNADGAIGGTAQKIGGPLDKEGMIGKHFNADGALGGTAQNLADKNQSS